MEQQEALFSRAPRLLFHYFDPLVVQEPTSQAVRRDSRFC
jgi:hypothetical protein